MKCIIGITLLLFLTSKINAQMVELDSMFSIEISEIKFKKTAGIFLGGIISGKGEKFIIINGVIHSKSKKRVEFPVYKMLLFTKEDEYMAKPDPNFTPFDDKDRDIKVKKKQKATIYIIVKDSFKTGDFYFGEELIGTLNVFDEPKRGELILNNKDINNK